ncbi:L-aspartate oxidase [Bacteroidota bacterium]
MIKYHFDILIIGSGLAGLYSALSSAEWCKVAVVTKSTLEESNTYWAQGGIAAAIHDDDSPVSHYKDTIKAGRSLCDEKAVAIMTNEGVDRVSDLMNIGMKFDIEKGKLALGMEGGHSKRRILHAGGDATGIKIADFLIEQVVNHKNIAVFENTFIYELLAFEKCCYGAYGYNFDNAEDIVFFANSTILAAGGASGIFRRTTNPHTSTGDGIALTYNAGARLADMEFVQFHPSAFYSDTGHTFLISEAVRGEGAHLVDHKGKRFMADCHEKAELAPRDVVAKAIYNEIKSSGKPNVFLKLDHLNADYIKKRFSHINIEANKFDIDITKDPVPIAPAAHYMIGGILTGYEAETNVKRLFACGEVSMTGVHGANRLASNSLLECLVFGKRAADSAMSVEKEYIDSSKMVEERRLKIDSSKEELFTKAKNEIADLMTMDVGIVRSSESLASAEKAIEKVLQEFQFEEQEYYSIKLRSLVTICKAILISAKLREESRGSHIRDDFPGENSNCLFRTIQQQDQSPMKIELIRNNSMEENKHGEITGKCC